MKPGYRTSEFWFTLVSFVISGLFLFGIITDSDTKDELIDVVTHSVESCILISGQLTILYRYMKDRNKEKVEYEKTKQKRQDNIQKEIEDYVGVDKVLIKVNINTGRIGELIQLPHIGTSLAEKIIEYRNENGPFQDIRDIRNVNGIGKSTYKDIENYISL